ncbi:MAG: hydrolase 2, exosortase A system-associated [Burkholderiaceae bacterium]
MPSTGPFFMRIDGSERFCYFHAAVGAPRGAILAVHAFAEEMNKTRAAAADGARALAADGYAVLQIDLTGCGDSDGEFGEATWAGWLADLGSAWAWLGLHAVGPRWVWGMRLGALLADQFAATCSPRADGLLLWQPVVNGTQHLGQFLRLKTVNSLLRGAATADAGKPSPLASVAQASPRADLAAGRTVEVAGYSLTPLLADAMEAARLGSHANPDARVPRRVRWFEISSQVDAALSPVAARIVDRWRAAGSDVAVVQVVGTAFWQTQEVERCAALVDATVAAMNVMDAA